MKNVVQTTPITHKHGYYYIMARKYPLLIRFNNVLTLNNVFLCPYSALIDAVSLA